MSRLQNTITTNALIALASFALAAQSFAHGGFDHVMGTVVKLENNVLTVKTAKGDVAVKIDQKTELSKGTEKAAVSSLEPGVRVVVDIPEGSKDKIAHSVKIGAAGGADAHTHK